MFTGLVERTGRIRDIQLGADQDGGRLIVDCGIDYVAKIGDSISVNGCCLTVAQHVQSQMTFDLSGETLRCTNFSAAKTGDHVNLERALRLGDRLGGHMVSGHVDGVACVVSFETRSEKSGGVGASLIVEVDRQLAPFIASKGSMTVNGVSLTINDVISRETQSPERIAVRFELVPVTLSATNLGGQAVGGQVNVEIDLVARYLGQIAKAYLPR